MRRRVFDYQFVAMVAIVLAILTRGALLPVVVVTAVVALVLLGCDLVARWRDRRPVGSGEPTVGAEVTDADLSLWVAAVERMLDTKH